MLIKIEVKIELPIIWLGSLLERFEQVLDAVPEFGSCKVPLPILGQRNFVYNS